MTSESALAKCDSAGIKRICGPEVIHSAVIVRVTRYSLLVRNCPMFVNGVQAISSRLENLSLDYQSNMHPKSDRPPVCPKTQLPHFQLTPSDGQKKNDGSPQAAENPWLLKPQHEIPATPPPQTKQQPGHFFPQRIG